MPVVNLPLGATEDRIIGSLDIQKALRSGDKQLEPGLLAALIEDSCMLTKLIC